MDDAGKPCRHGTTCLAAVTALPEVSSGIQAVQLGAVGLAMSDIYGGNAVQLTFFLLADILAGDPVLPSEAPNRSGSAGSERSSPGS
jgi:Ca2+/Na+ antiporter